MSAGGTGSGAAGSGPAGSVASGRSVQVSTARPMLALERDPCPGDVAAVRTLVASLRTAADSCDTGAVVADAWQPAAWRDEVAHAVAGHVGRVVAGTRELGRSLAHAGDALQRWAGALADLQAEADALDREAQDIRRRRDEVAVGARELVMDPLAGLDGRRVAEVAELDSELDRIRARADELHLRWAAASRSHATDLDGAATATGSYATWWRSSWDAGHDVTSYGLRLASPLIAGQAEATGIAATLTASAAGVPGLAPVAAPLAVGLAALEVAQRTALAVGVGGSGRPVLSAVAGIIPGAGAAVAARTASRAAAARTRPGGADTAADGRTRRPLDPSVESADVGTVFLLDVTAPQHTGATTTGTLAVVPAGASTRAAPTGPPSRPGRGRLAVTVHDVEQPWETATGTPLLDGADHFAAVAVVTAPVGALRPAPGGPAPGGSGERDHEDGVGRRDR